MSTTKPQYRSLVIPAVDGYQLHAALFEPDIPIGRTVVIASAMGVLQQYYYNIGEYLRQRGFRFITFDYRGIGKSAPETLKGFNAMLHDWGELDIEGVLQHVKTTWPGDELQFMSHSVGGQIFGFAPSNKDVSKVAMVASQSGYWNLWPGVGKFRMWTISYIAMPLLTNLTGYMPAKKLNLFEDVPKGVSNQWTRWIRNSKYMFVEDRPTLDNFSNVTASMRLISISDDSYAPPATVDWLANKYSSAQIERINYTPADFDLNEIGHFAYFKRKFQPYFWDDLVAYLQET